MIAVSGIVAILFGWVLAWMQYPNGSRTASIIGVWVMLAGLAALTVSLLIALAKVLP